MYLGRQFRSRIDTALLTKLRQDREDCDYHLYRPSPKIVDRYINDAQRFVDRVTLQVQGGGPSES